MRPTPATRTDNALLDIIDTILDKGIVIDAQISVSVVGIELISIKAHVVIASVDTYLRYARAVMELNEEYGEQQGYIPASVYQRRDPGLMETLGDATEKVSEGAARGKRKGVLGK